MALSFLVHAILLCTSCIHARKIIFDTDGRADDAVALLWTLHAFNKQAINIAAITTVRSSPDISAFDAYRNVIYMLNISKQADTKSALLRIPVAKPDNSSSTTSSANDGLFGFTTTAQSYTDIFSLKTTIARSFRNAPSSPDLIISTLLSAPHTIDIITTGPLTNLKLAQQKHPGILSLARSINVYGGAFKNKSLTDSAHSRAEFNFNADPTAVRQVLNAGASVNVFVFAVDTASALSMDLQSMGLFYSLLGQSAQTQIEMCRMKWDKDSGEGYEQEEEEEYEVVCSAGGLVYLFMEKTLEAMMRQSYLDGGCDCMRVPSAAVVGFVQYAQLFVLKNVRCEVDEGNGAVWFDEALRRLEKGEGAQASNCFVNVDMDGERVRQAFIRDLVELVEALSAEWMDEMDFGMQDMYDDEEGMYGDEEYAQGEVGYDAEYADYGDYEQMGEYGDVGDMEGAEGDSEWYD